MAKNSRAKTPIMFKVIIAVIIGIFCSLSINLIRGNGQLTETKKPMLSLLSIPGPRTLCPDFHEDTNRVIYIENSGHECLTARQACSVESAARSNPKMDINIFLNAAQFGRYDFEQHVFRPGRVRSCSFNELLLLKHKNVHVSRENFTKTIPGTELMKMLQSQTVFQSRESFDVALLNDLMRLMILNETGGIYLDFDNIVLRPLHCLRNTLALSESSSIENSVMAIGAGHPFVRYLSEQLSDSYKSGSRTLDSLSYGRPFKSFCNQPKLKPGTFHCFGNSSLKLMDSDTFFPVKREQLQYFYIANFSELNMEPMSRAYLVNVYLSMLGTEAHHSSLYAQLARKYCPSVWKLTRDKEIPLGF